MRRFQTPPGVDHRAEPALVAIAMAILAALCFALGLPQRLAESAAANGWVAAICTILVFAGLAALILLSRRGASVEAETPPEAAHDTHPLADELREALHDWRIVPHFQPVMELEQGRIIGFEALARWPHPVHGMIPPDHFIPLAEQLGLIGEVSDLILRGACEAAREWPEEIWLSINLSPLQLKDPGLAERLLAILDESGVAHDRLIIEVSEAVALEDDGAVRDIFAVLQIAGVQIALDDFGRGYSRLYQLRDTGFDQLKLDRSFVQAMEAEANADILSAVAGLGKAFGMPVTAKGVESWDEARMLRAMGCEQAQGFLFGEALDAAATLDLVKSQTAIISHLARSG